MQISVQRLSAFLLLAASAVSLLAGEPEAPKKSGLPPPPEKRTRAEIDGILKKASPAIPEDKLRPLNILLLAGKKDHGPGEHDYPLWQKNWTPLVKKLPKVTVDTAFDWPTPEQLKAADLLIVFCHPPWNENQLKDIDSIFARNGGVVLMHWAVGGTKDTNLEQLEARFGLAYNSSGYRHGLLELKLTADAKDSSIVQGLPETLNYLDEAYWPVLGDRSKVKVLAISEEAAVKGVPAKEAMPQIWTIQHEHEKGRAFCHVPGHYNWSFDDPLFRLFLLRGWAWAAGEPEQRFDALATDGVEFKAE